MKEIEHKYGDRVHIVGGSVSHGLLSRLCAKETVQPEVNLLVSELYRYMVHRVLVNELPTRRVERATRMVDVTPKGVWSGEVIDPDTHAIVACVARAGIFPSQVCFDYLNWLLPPVHVRQDHMIMARTTDDSGRVTGAAIHGAKIGGSIEGAFLLLPDPMGATGSTMATVRNHYRTEIEGKPEKLIALNLIVTPEYLKKVLELDPDLTVYAVRLDRGLSSADILATVPGEHWDQEKGLNDQGYIVPGGGGFGEIMNNSWV